MLDTDFVVHASLLCHSFWVMKDDYLVSGLCDGKVRILSDGTFHSKNVKYFMNCRRSSRFPHSTFYSKQQTRFQSIAIAACANRWFKVAT